MSDEEKIYKIIGAAMSVHSYLKHGLAESVYQEALSFEFKDQEIPFEEEVQVPIIYKNHRLNKYYQLDFLCYDNIIVELKSAAGITSEHRAQLFNYLRITQNVYGILLNFGESSLHIERYQYNPVTNQCEGFHNKILEN
ncbi:MAG: GxxExxY protein [Prevotellaceae bacterium]|nr:GxxExxY protein [Prevotellaceae bacterium]